ncbi:MAG: hypothetical protein HYR55_15725 [Acidobacteria bacterium]|nr:hypothetical protein [Acidobacteriota bacterium]MBI3655953.1 hypothetical protein [Acidobacteriota bacterium]
MYDILNVLLGTRAKISVLRTLVASKPGFSAREIERRAKVPLPSCLRALRELEALGVVHVARGRREHRYVLNRAHYLVETVIVPAFEAEHRLRRALILELRKGLQGNSSCAVYIYGSVARRESHGGSDLDVLVVARTRRAADRIAERIRERSLEIRERFGYPLSVLTLGRKEALHPPPELKPFLRRVQGEAVPVVGGELLKRN